ncbi:MAG: hypothetical protein QX192_11260 [Methylococcales bacterium]
MNKILLSLLIGTLSGNVFAACPASAAMSGKYSGQGTYTEFNDNSLDAVAEKLIIVSFDGKGTATFKGKATVSLYIEASPGETEVKIESTSVIVPYTFDSKNCSMQVWDGGGNINFVVANAGNTLYGVKRDKEFQGVERYLFTKQ